MTKPRIFIASAGESLNVANAIQSNLDHDADCTVWSQGVMRLSRTAMQNLLAQLDKSDFGIFVFNPDDVLSSRGKQHEVARDNVVLELGLFASRLGVERTFIVKPRGVAIKLPSDLQGLTPAEYEPHRQDNNLQAALGPACTAILKELADFKPPEGVQKEAGMADPLTLSAVGAVALTEGIKFLYGQAGEAIKRWQQRKAAKASAVDPEAVKVELPSDAFEGQLKEPKLDLAAVGRLENELRDLRKALAEYADGVDEVDPKNKQLLETVDGLRRAMEAVYGQRIAFKGEPGPPSGVAVVGEAKVDEVFGYVAGLRAKRIISGSVTGKAEAKIVHSGGEAIGVEVDTIGSPGPGPS